MEKKSDHYKLGFRDATSGRARYVFQDKFLQELYDKGYKAGGLISGTDEQEVYTHRCPRCSEPVGQRLHSCRRP